ncbi:hypothetical protein PanWU01x14_198300, partial [Parasponia andersonii]
ARFLQAKSQLYVTIIGTLATIQGWTTTDCKLESSPAILDLSLPLKSSESALMSI